MKLALVFILVLSSCASRMAVESSKSGVLVALPPEWRAPASVNQFTTWYQWLRSHFGSINHLYPDGEAIQNWRISSEFDADGVEIPPSAVQEIPLKCGTQLYPAEYSTLTKQYIFGIEAAFDPVKIKGDSEGCAVPTNGTNKCIVGLTAMLVIMADTYEDQCGNFYRGYFVKHYTKGQGRNQGTENMGTLIALGRTVYPKAQAAFAGEFYNGQTYPVARSEFVFLSPLWPNDLKKINESRAAGVRAGYRYDSHKKIFIPPGE
jgi:hypothetical protein